MQIIDFRELIVQDAERVGRPAQGLFRVSNALDFVV
jgi:hypothetical protein